MVIDSVDFILSYQFGGLYHFYQSGQFCELSRSYQFGKIRQFCPFYRFLLLTYFVEVVNLADFINFVGLSILPFGRFFYHDSFSTTNKI